jgi:hypothetical protein
MKFFPIISLMIGWTVSFAAEPMQVKEEKGRVRAVVAPRAWLGLQVSKPDPSMTSQLPSLPQGIGFVIVSVDKGGPAETAGLKEFDLLWKLGDQMLVNEAQLAALLRLSKPGDSVSLSGFRAGKPMEVQLKLGETPLSNQPVPLDLVESSILPGGFNGPIRVVNVAEKLATYSTEEGRAEVRREGEICKVNIEGPKGESIFAGDLPADGSLDSVPEPWRRRIQALRRGLDQALEGRMMINRLPRPRVVPPAQLKP